MLFGSDVANDQPVVMKYLHLAKKEGTRVVVVNPYREPGLERYWVPSIAESAMFGTRMTDEFFPVAVGGDIAFITGVLKRLRRHGRARPGVHRGAHRPAGTRWRSALDDLGWDELERLSGDVARRHGAVRGDVRGRRRRGAGVVDGAHPARASAPTTSGRRRTLALARGNVGRAGAGLMPIRGHSGVQGGAEMGAYATAFPGGVPVGEESAAAPVGALGLRRARGAGPRRGADGRGGGGRASWRCSTRAAATSWTRSPTPGLWRAAWRARRCACTRTSW